MTRSRGNHGRYTSLEGHISRPEKHALATELYRLKRANLLHLLDLKRAGHSPTRTELHLMNKTRTKQHKP